MPARNFDGRANPRASRRRARGCRPVSANRRLGRSWQREDEARSDEQRRGEAVDTQSLPELPAVGEDDQCVGRRGDRRRDEHPAKRRGTGGGPGDEEYYAGGDVAGSLDLGETAEVVCGDPEVEGRLSGLKDEASAEDDDRETCDEGRPAER